MKPLIYLKTNYLAIAKEALWMWVIIVGTNALAQAGLREPVFGSNPMKYFLLVTLLFIPAGIGSHLINRRIKGREKNG